MDTTKPIDLKQIARPLHFSVEQVQAVVDLLDAGNTVPFITRYRKDATGGLDEEQIRAVQSAAEKQRQLLDRRQQIIRSIESQNKLTDELRQQIERANVLGSYVMDQIVGIFTTREIIVREIILIH